jgi:hypothetical protein
MDDLRGDPADLTLRNAHAGQGRIDEVEQREVVVADDRYVVRYPDPQPTSRPTAR